jgi:hypothetical protein
MKECDLVDLNPCSPAITKFDPAPNGAGVYRPQFKLSSDSIHMYAFGNEVAETNFNPLTVWDTMWQDQSMGETKHLRSDVPGNSANRASFSNLQKYTDGSGSLANINNTTSGSFPLSLQLQRGWLWHRLRDLDAADQLD